MIIDITGIELTPGNSGKDCLGNGENGNLLLCDECDFFMCCINKKVTRKICETCNSECVRSKLAFHKPRASDKRET